MPKNVTISTENFFKLASKRIILNEDRKKILFKISKRIAKEYTENKAVNLNFICTHNSRRSQLGQVWAFYAANYFSLNIDAFSGGTEVTAFYKNTVKTLKSVGFNFKVVNFSHDNPTYLISFEGSEKTIFGFSKKFDNPENKNPFIVITTCNNTDKNCPFIPTAIERFHLPFIDPKYSDDTPDQTTIYLKSNEQIAAEVFFIFTEIKKLIN